MREASEASATGEREGRIDGELSTTKAQPNRVYRVRTSS